MAPKIAKNAFNKFEEFFVAPKIALDASKNNSFIPGAATLNITASNMKQNKKAEEAAFTKDANPTSSQHQNDPNTLKSTLSPSSPWDDQDPTQVLHYDVVMMTHTTTLEEQMASAMKMIELLTKRSEMQEARMDQIMSRLEASSGGLIVNKSMDAHDEKETSQQEGLSKGKEVSNI